MGDEDHVKRCGSGLKQSPRSGWLKQLDRTQQHFSAVPTASGCLERPLLKSQVKGSPDPGFQGSTLQPPHRRGVHAPTAGQARRTPALWPALQPRASSLPTVWTPQQAGVPFLRPVSQKRGRGSVSASCHLLVGGRGLEAGCPSRSPAGLRSHLPSWDPCWGVQEEPGGVDTGVSSQLTNQKSTGRSARASGTFLHQFEPGHPRPPLGPCHCIPGEDRGLAPAGPCSWQPRQGHGCARKPERGLQVLPPGAPMQAGPLIQGQGPGGRPGGTPNVGAEQHQAEYRTPASLSAGRG